MDADGPTNENYSDVDRILREAFEQCATGKGHVRHAIDGEPFDDQIGMWIAMRGLDHPRGQAVKKIDESMRQSPDKAKFELLGAIVELVKAVRVCERREAGCR
jgi:hypothetical protein